MYLLMPNSRGQNIFTSGSNSFRPNTDLVTQRMATPRTNQLCQITHFMLVFLKMPIIEIKIQYYYDFTLLG